MSAVFEYFATIPVLHKGLWLVACLGLATLLEFFIPLRRAAYNKLEHFKPNLALLVSSILINAVFSTLVLAVAFYTQAHHFGLLNWVSLPLWAEFLIALLLLDGIAQYTVHYLLHKVPLLWRFHQAHHSDTSVDATTGTRHHPVDYFVRECFSLTVVALLGVPPEFYVAYRLMTLFFAYFTHANIRLPGRMDRVLSVIVITPVAHKFHHHYQQPWTDTNFGNIFSVWDRVFRTFVYEDIDDVVYGVDTMDASQSNSLKYQLTHAFK